jgi:hypothetical protein
MGEVVYTSRVEVVRTEGRRRRIDVPGAAEPLAIGVHGAIAAHYGVEPGAEPERASTLDLLVAAAAG